MKKALQLVSNLNQDLRWKFKQHGICIALKNGVPACCFIFESWEKAEILDFEAELAKLRESYDLKLIGNNSFIMALRRWAVLNTQHNLVKTIIRDVPFEMLYTAAEKQFKISTQPVSEVDMRPAAALRAAGGPTSTPQPQVGRKIKVLIVDDSQTIRKVLTSIFEQDPGIEVVGALEKPSLVEPFIEKLRPDVMTLDIHMPEMDGVTLLKKIAPKYSIPTIMISSITKEDGPFVFDALENGAFDYIQKPSFKEIPSLGPHILERVRVAALSRVTMLSEKAVVSQVSDTWSNDCIILVGASTGGTEALAALLKQFPDKIPPVLVVQHIPPVFSKAFAERLDSMFRFRVVEAADGDRIEPNKVLIAPGGKHMGIVKTGGEYRVVINEEAPVNRHRPSVDYLFNSAAKVGLKSVIGVILTGMGADGSKGLLELRKKGAHTIGQDEGTCVVYGMPKVAAEIGAVEVVSPIGKIGQEISKMIQKFSGRK